MALSAARTDRSNKPPREPRRRLPAVSSCGHRCRHRELKLRIPSPHYDWFTHSDLCVAANQQSTTDTARPPSEASAKHKIRGQPGFARLFVLCAHVLTGIGEGFDRRVEVNTMP